MNREAVAASPFVPLGERYHRPLHLVSFARELWAARALVRALSERELRARYKAALLGAAWAFITPLGYVLVFTVFFNRVVRIDTDGVPYALFSYVALIPWGFFSSCLLIGSLAPLTNLTLLNKVACPREVFTLAAIATSAVDAAITALALPVLFLATGFAPKATIIWIPLILVAQLMLGLGLALLLGAILFYVRDVRHALPMFAQLLLFATPVAFGFRQIPEAWRLPYSLVNPMAPIIEAYRSAILFGHGPDWRYFGPALAMSATVLVVGYGVFKRLEPGFADVG